MLNQEIPILVLAPAGPSLNDMNAMIEKLKQNQSELLVVSNQKELLGQGICSLAIPDTTNDVISPFLNVVVGQMFACQLALVKGLNPDNPRGLNKVTITK